MNIAFNRNSLINFLETSVGPNGEKASKEDIEQIGSLFDECDAIDGSNDGNISCSEGWALFQSKGMNNLRHLGGAIYSWMTTEKQKLMPQELEADQVKLAARIEKTYSDTRDKLVKMLETTGEYEHPVTGEKIPAKNLIVYLNKLTFKPEKSGYGTAQARKATGEIEINTNLRTPDGQQILDSEWNPSEPEIMKVLLHEALHNAYYTAGADPGFNTQSEERFCESNAIKLAALLTDDNLDTMYGLSYDEMTSDFDLLDKILEEQFIGGAYKHRPKDSSGAVNIEGHELASGARIFIDGQDVGCLGPSNANGALILDELDPQNISASGYAFQEYNKVVMNPIVGAKTLEIKDVNGNIFKAYLIPNPEQQSQKPQHGL